MRRKLIGGAMLAGIAWVAFISSSAIPEQGEDTVEAMELDGVYEYVCHHNRGDQPENHYLKFKSLGGRVVGTYFGTSEDFEREKATGCGYFTAIMDDLRVSKDSISFTLDVSDVKFFCRPVTPMSSSGANTSWAGTLNLKKREYHGRIIGNVISLEGQGVEDRVFGKVSR